MEMPETQQVEKNTYQIKNINGETFVIHVDNNDEKKFTKIAQITSDGDLIPQNITRVIGWSPNSQNISNEAEIKKNKVKTIQQMVRPFRQWACVQLLCRLRLLCSLCEVEPGRIFASEASTFVRPFHPTSAKRKCQITTGGDGGNRTRVQKGGQNSVYMCSCLFQ